ncbi:MAG TPA: carboxypeptidase regulatory-like domain-containing protein [Bacteroidia bacterium]|nr:carboxypeptidase regulatory-like domain-containing protein [Bacteroidia bacterium]
MKPFLIILISLITTLTAFGQADSGFTNKAEAKNLTVNGLKEGKWVESVYTNCCDRPIGDSNLEHYSLVIYKHGKPIGIVRDYDSSWKLIIYTVKGTVTDKYTHKPIEGITVKMVGSDGSIDSVETDTKGKYLFDPTKFKDMAAYMLTIKATSLGYLNSSENLMIPTVGRAGSFLKTFDWELEKSK